MGPQINILDEIIVDNFAGGGGASTGTGSCPMEGDFPWISSDSDGFCHRGEEYDKS